MNDMRNLALVKRFVMLLLVLCMLSCTACANVVFNADAAASPICINEVMSSNTHTLVDDALGTPDWIELYNASDKAVDLSGYGLSDNLKEPHKWTFPAVTIQPRAYMLVYACKQDADMCTGFALSKGGESIYLTDNYYNMLQMLDVPALEADISYARDKDGAYGYCASPTPGAENSEDIVKALTDIQYAGSDSLRISEILPRNTKTLESENGMYYPYVKLCNTASSPVSLAAFCLSDNSADPIKWQMPDVTVAPGGFATVFMSGKDKNDGELHASFKLGSKDDTVYLSDVKGVILDSMSYDPALLDDIAVVASNVYTAFPAPYGENDTRTFTNTAPVESADIVLLNEVLVDNQYSLADASGDRVPWAELYNTTGERVSLEGYCLSDNADDPLKWAFPAETAIEPNGYLLVFLDGKDQNDGALHTPFTLSKKDGALLFTNKNGLLTQRIQIDPAIGKNIAVGLDENGRIAYFATPTPGAKNSAHAFETMGALTLPDPSGVYISEVCAVNPAKSGKADWIELHNASGHDVNLKGWRLTDDPDVPDAFTFPDLSLKAGGYCSVEANGDQEGVTAPFGISNTGETLLLFDDDGEIRDVFSTGVLRAGVTSGRAGGNTERVFFSTPTRNQANAEAALPGYAQAPAFSDITLYHEDSFSLQLTSQTAGATIYYTTDGSKPTRESTAYTAPIDVKKNAIVKAIAVKEGLLDSDLSAATYIFNKPHTLPVVCLSTDSVSFDQVYSVIDRWEKVEREGYCEYYEADGRRGTDFPCGLRVNGASTLLARQKSLSIFLRAGYGVSQTSYPFFSDSDVDIYKSLCVRNSGQDRDKARMRDSLFAKAVKGMNIETVETRPVVVYINAQYWGVYDLNENQNEEYLATHYGVDPNAVDIIRRNETRLAGEKADMKRIREYAVNRDLSNDALFAEYCQWVDEDYFTDYLIAQTFFANGDMFNQKYWRSQDYAVKWRPVFFDLDLGLSASNPARSILPEYFKIEGVPSQDQSITNMDLYCGFRKNPGWCDRFCARYVYVVYNMLTSERLTSLLDTYQAELAPEMARHIEKWGDPSSVSAWEKYVSSLRSCLEQRRDYALKAMQKEFGISSEKMQSYIDAAQSAAVVEPAGN